MYKSPPNPSFTRGELWCVEHPTLKAPSLVKGRGLGEGFVHKWWKRIAYKSPLSPLFQEGERSCVSSLTQKSPSLYKLNLGDFFLLLKSEEGKGRVGGNDLSFNIKKWKKISDVY